MIDFDDVLAKVKAGQKVSLCRCYKSAKFPYCDGSHIKHNEETGDNIAPAVLTSGLDPSKRGFDFKTQVQLGPDTCLALDFVHHLHAQADAMGSAPRLAAAAAC
jgi:CDGSH-type Zn-finger protein